MYHRLNLGHLKLLCLLKFVAIIGYINYVSKKCFFFPVKDLFSIWQEKIWFEINLQRSIVLNFVFIRFQTLSLRVCEIGRKWQKSKLSINLLGLTPGWKLPSTLSRLRLKLWSFIGLTPVQIDLVKFENFSQSHFHETNLIFFSTRKINR